MNILDFYKMNNFLNKYFGCILPASKTAVTKCLKLIWNHSGIISGTYFSPFQGVYYLYRSLRRAPKSYFGLILDFWIIFLIFCEWIILLNILDSIEWIFRILFWIEFRIESFLGPIQWKNEFSKCIAQGYPPSPLTPHPHPSFCKHLLWSQCLEGGVLFAHQCCGSEKISKPCRFLFTKKNVLWAE